jgi:hypothetical protein
MTSALSLATYTFLRKVMKIKVLSVRGCNVVRAHNLREVGDWAFRKLTERRGKLYAFILRLMTTSAASGNIEEI